MQFNKLNVSNLSLLILFCFLFVLGLIVEVEHPILLTLYSMLYITGVAILVKISIKISQILAVLTSTDINTQTSLMIFYCSTLNIIIVIFLQFIDSFISFDNFINIFIK